MYLEKLSTQCYNYYQSTVSTSSDQHTNSDHIPQPVEGHKLPVTLSLAVDDNSSQGLASVLYICNHLFM